MQEEIFRERRGKNEVKGFGKELNRKTETKKRKSKQVQKSIKKKTEEQREKRKADVTTQ